MTDKDELVKKAELAGKDGRYDKMATFMKAAAETGTELSVNEMFSLRIAYCNVFRALWSEISSIKQKTDTSVYGSDEYDEDEEVRKFLVCSTSKDTKYVRNVRPFFVHFAEIHRFLNMPEI